MVISEFIVLIALSILMIIIGWYALKTASLENNGRFLMNNKFRMPILIIGSIYITICLGGHYSKFNYESLITTTQAVTLLVKMILIFIVTATAFWFLMYKWKTIKKL
ncbi:Membrane protein [Listeria innocua]|nr:Membrane protein [Listeria innocua]